MEATFTFFTSNSERTKRSLRKSLLTAHRLALHFFIVATTRIWPNQLAQYESQTIFNYDFDLFQFLAKNSNSLCYRGIWRCVRIPGWNRELSGIA